MFNKLLGVLCSNPFSPEATKHLKDQMRKGVHNHSDEARSDASEGNISFPCKRY